MGSLRFDSESALALSSAFSAKRPGLSLRVLQHERLNRANPKLLKDRGIRTRRRSSRRSAGSVETDYTRIIRAKCALAGRASRDRRSRHDIAVGIAVPAGTRTGGTGEGYCTGQQGEIVAALRPSGQHGVYQLSVRAAGGRSGRSSDGKQRWWVAVAIGRVVRYRGCVHRPNRTDGRGFVGCHSRSKQVRNGDGGND